MFPGDLQEVTESLNVTAERVGADYHFPLHVYTMIYESGFKAFFITLSASYNPRVVRSHDSLDGSR